MGEFPQLTARQREIVKLISEGHNAESIGGQLGISKETVKRHKDNIYKRLRVNNVVELVLKLYDLKEKV